jgi:sarcosine oxidase
MTQSYDTIVVGLGAVGAATLWQLARRGQRVLGIDRWAPPHDRGSTHGESRITRCGVAEGFDYVPLVLRSHEIWRELEAECQESLLVQCGALMLGRADGKGSIHGKDDLVGRAIAAAERFAIPHEVLDAAEAMRRFPPFRMGDEERAYFEPSGGYVRPERCVAAQLSLAQRHGAQTRLGTQVTRIERDGAGVAVVSATGERFHAAEIVLAAGTWSAGLLGGELARHLTVRRQVLYWFPAREPSSFTPEHFPVFIWSHGSTAEDSFYGFPQLPGSAGVKLATEQYLEATPDPDALRREVSAEETASMVREHVEPRLSGLLPRASRAVVCAYTCTPDGDFLIERAPENDRVLLVSACSGHGFKHSAGLGEAIAEMLTHNATSLAAFGAARLPRAA